MKKTLFILGAFMFVAMAFAELPVSTGKTTMEFQAIPLEGHPLGAAHVVIPYRFYDKIIVTVQDPVICGQKPLNPSFKIEGKDLQLKYELSPPPTGSPKSCFLVSEFSIFNVPHLDLNVNFAGGNEPYIVTKLIKCPYYKPKTEDIYECLVPDGN